MNEALKATLVETAEAIQARRLSPVELMEAVLARIDETNGDLNAVVALRDREVLRAEARAAERRVTGGTARPLEGIPLGVKDLEDVEGMVTSNGSLVFRDNVALRDSTQVGRLRAAGAIVVGKTNTPEFGWTAVTTNRLFGTTRSPWDLSRTPGGSSGGSAAAMAACVLPLVTSSDGGGSIRIPASFTGCFGFKPSYGRVPRGPFARWDYSDTSHYGPTTRTVEDAALFLDQVSGPSPQDPTSLPAPGYSYVTRLGEALPGKLRIAYSPDLGYAVVQSDIAAAVAEAARVFAGLGHAVSEIEGGPPELGFPWVLQGNFFAAAFLHRYLPDHEEDFGQDYLRGVKNGWTMTPEHFGEVQELRALLNDWTADLFDRFDLLLTPTMPFDPPPAEGPFPTEVEGRAVNPVGIASFTIPFNMSWHPAATVRVGLSRAGLPIGMQIVGPRHRDDLVLQAALAFEHEHPWHPHWPTAWEPLPG